MKKLTQRILSVLCLAALVMGIMLPVGALAAEPEHTIWLVGDSTVCDYTGKDLTYYWPRNGYGMQIGQYLDDTYKVNNLAISGDSSLNFLDETNYQTLMDGMKEGDALLIGFGHNDEKIEDPARYTSGNGDWQTEGSFAKNLWDNYVSPAQAKGVEVVLCTPIVRRSTGATITGNNAHVTANGDYPQAIRDLGAAKNVAVADLTAKTKALYEEQGPDKTLLYHAESAKDVPDNTHLNVYGAQVVAQLLAQELKANTSLALSAHVDPDKFTPNQADVTIGPEYQEPGDYAPPSTESVLGTPYTCTNPDGATVTFKPTGFGPLGGTPVAGSANWTMETDGDGNMHMAVASNKGKITSQADGIIMYYFAVPAGKQFSLTATATLNKFDTNSQVAFGLMARDELLIDARDCYPDGSYPNYVAAGTLGDGSTNCFYRKDGALTKTSPLTTPLAAGSEYKLNITSNSDGYTCTFGDETPQSNGFDFSLLNIDTQYVYVGMFAARNVDVTFHDISLEVEGGIPEEPSTPPTEEPSTPPTDEPSAPSTDEPTTPPVVEIDGMKAGGGLETLFAELAGLKDADVTAVKYTGAMTGELTGDDFTYLVRDAEGGVRIDIPGLKAGKYDLTVTVGGKDYTATGIEVQAHDRSGFAHQTVADDSSCTPYTEGVGAYNDDGTLKDNAIVLYVTDENKDTVTLSSKDENRSMTVTGIGKILNSNESKVNLFLLRAIALFDKRPLDIRFVGTVTKPEGVSAFKMGSSNGSMAYMLSGANITLEGIGTDATIDGWGFSFGADKNDAKEGLAKNFEVRNLAFRNVPEDCVEVTGRGSDTIEVPVTHAWVHNCAFYVPHIENPAESDKAEGDGSLDFKWGLYMTSSYNYFEKNHKTSLVGGADKNPQYHITWHHNHWNSVNSRAPLARQADMHIYNNYYEGQTGYCMSLRASTYIFSEANTFLNCKDTMIDEGTHGVCKSYNDVFTNCTGKKDCTVVTDKSQKVEDPENENKFANFDTAPGSYVAKGEYKLDTAEEALKNIETYGGLLHIAATVPFTTQGGDEPTTPPTDEPSTPPTDEPTTPPTDEPTTPPSEEPTEPTVTINGKTEMSRGSTQVLTVTVKNGEKDSVYWTSSDATVLTVAQTGKVTAVKAGTATVTAAVTLKDGAVLTATIDITVKAGVSSTTGTGGVSGGSGNTNQGGSTTDKNYRGDKVTTVTTAAGGKTVTVTDEAGEVVAKVVVPAQTPDLDYVFEDVADNFWGKDAIYKAAGMGIFQGVSDTAHLFDTNGVVTRGTVAQMLFNLSQGKAGIDSPFADSKGAWYSDAVAWAAAADVVEGISETAFAPNQNVTREQLVTMLYRYAQLLNGDTTAAGNINMTQFNDTASISSWATQAVEWAVSVGLLQGRGNGKLDPTATATRAEAAAIMSRFVAFI